MSTGVRSADGASERSQTPGDTAALARAGMAVSFDTLPADVLAVAKHCLLDWLGVTFAGSREVLSEILTAELCGGDGRGGGSGR